MREYNTVQHFLLKDILIFLTSHPAYILSASTVIILSNLKLTKRTLILGSLDHSTEIVSTVRDLTTFTDHGL